MKNNTLNQPIAILGGMGPQASARILTVMIEKCSQNFGAEMDSEFPELILNSIPVPNFISSEETMDEVLGILTNRVKNLEKLDPLCFAIACNTAHLLLDDLQTNTKVPFVSIIDGVVADILDTGIKKVGLLATPTTIKSGLYQRALGQRGISVLIPPKKDILEVEKVILKILGGKILASDRQKLVIVANSMRKRGAKGIILGCTELPLIFPKNFPTPVFDSIEILAQALLQKFYERN